MIDQQFHHRAGPFSLADVAAHIGGALTHPDSAHLLVRDIAAPQCAAADEICACNDARFLEACQHSKALAIITGAKQAKSLSGRLLLIAPDPRLAYAQAAHLFYPAPPPIPGIDPKASVADTAVLGAGCRIEASAVVGSGALVGARCHIGRGTVLGDGVEIGDDCRIDANVTISNAKLGPRCAIAAGTTIGGAGFGFVPSPQGIVRIPQLGRVLIGADVEIGNNCTIDRGALGDTEIGIGTKIDNLVHIAHNVRIGRFCIITAQVGIAGSSSVGDGTMIGGQVAIADHIQVGANVRIVPQSGVMRDIPDGQTVGGSPAMPVREWHRQTIALAKLAGVKPCGGH